MVLVTLLTLPTVISHTTCYATFPLSCLLLHPTKLAIVSFIFPCEVQIRLQTSRPNRNATYY